LSLLAIRIASLTSEENADIADPDRDDEGVNPATSDGSRSLLHLTPVACPVIDRHGAIA
jgi:hypothetical protein